MNIYQFIILCSFFILGICCNIKVIGNQIELIKL